jgi:hypothetical protein
MLQVFHLDVVKVDLMLHILQWEPPTVVACCSCWGAAVGHRAGARHTHLRHASTSGADDWDPRGFSRAGAAVRAGSNVGSLVRARETEPVRRSEQGSNVGSTRWIAKTGGELLLRAACSCLLAWATFGRKRPDASYSEIKCQNKIVTNVNYNILHKNEVHWLKINDQLKVEH